MSWPRTSAGRRTASWSRRRCSSTDLAAEWQRVATIDNADSFLDKHGGKDKVFADAELKRAYERRTQIRDSFLELMREGYKRHKETPPFDKGEKAELAGTTLKVAAAKAVALATVPPAAGAEAHWPRFRGPSGQGFTGAPACRSSGTRTARTSSGAPWFQATATLRPSSGASASS